MYWDEDIAHGASRLAAFELPKYFVLWLHEYCHFIGYCLQRRPIGAAYAILYTELLKGKQEQEGFSFHDIRETMNAKKDGPSTKVAETIFHLHRLDEGMANFLQELLLQELGIDPGDYFGELMRENPFYPYFKKWERKRFLEILVDWNNAKLNAPEFMQNFLQSLNSIKVTRHPFKP